MYEASKLLPALPSGCYWLNVLSKVVALPWYSFVYAIRKSFQSSEYATGYDYSMRLMVASCAQSSN